MGLKSALLGVPQPHVTLARVAHASSNYGHQSYFCTRAATGYQYLCVVNKYCSKGQGLRAETYSESACLFINKLIVILSCATIAHFICLRWLH